MKHVHFSRLAILAAAVACAALPELTNVAANTAYADEALRPEISKLMKSAGDFLKDRKYKEAMGKVREADGIGGKNGNESLTVERMRLSIATASNDSEGIIRAAEAIVASSKQAPKEQQLKYIQMLANAYYRTGNYAKAASYYSRYFEEGGTDKSLRQYMIQAMSQGGDGSKALKEVAADVAADEKAGRVPSQANLEYLANAAFKQKDTATYNSTLEKLIVFYGKKEYWATLLASVPRKNGFNQRLMLDVFRLKLAVGQLTKTEDFMEFAQLALQAGYPSEGIKIIDAGYKAGALGTGEQVNLHKRLRDLANTKLADRKAGLVDAEAAEQKSKDGNAALVLGYNLVNDGQFDKGIALMQTGLTKGNLKNAEDAKLHLGIAYLQAGKKADAIKVFKTVKGTDGTADLAHYWTTYANQTK
jgi:tetratricopeptide (TPR) repeat protein